MPVGKIFYHLQTRSGELEQAEWTYKLPAGTRSNSFFQLAALYLALSRNSFLFKFCARVCSLRVCCNELLLTILSEECHTCICRAVRNKTAKLDLLQVDLLSFLAHIGTADRRAYVSTGKIGYTVFLILCLIKLTRIHEDSNIFIEERGNIKFLQRWYDVTHCVTKIDYLQDSVGHFRESNIAPLIFMHGEKKFVSAHHKQLQ